MDLFGQKFKTDFLLFPTWLFFFRLNFGAQKFWKRTLHSRDMVVLLMMSSQISGKFILREGLLKIRNLCKILAWPTKLVLYQASGTSIHAPVAFTNGWSCVHRALCAKWWHSYFHKAPEWSDDRHCYRRGYSKLCKYLCYFSTSTYAICRLLAEKITHPLRQVQICLL